MPSYCPHCVTPMTRAQANDATSAMFGRLFPQLAAASFDQGHDLALAVTGGPMDIGLRDEAALDNRRIPAGWAFFGQILAHDMTRDRAPLQPNQGLDGLRNYRRPRLDLECVYGDGPLGQPYLYDNTDGDKLLVAPNEQGELNDIPRNHQGIAVIGDQRNDSYLFIAHLHVALLKLHNHLVDIVRYLDRLVHDRETAEDLCHETFVKALCHWSDLEHVAVAHSWLYRVAINTAYDYLRRRRRMANMRLTDAHESPMYAPTLETQFDDADSVWAALKHLPNHYLFSPGETQEQR